MELKSHGKCLVFCALLIFMGCLTVVNASEISDNTTNVVYDDIQSIDTQEQYTQEIIKTEDVMEKKVSKKESSTENVKMANQVTVNSYQQLLEEVENAKKSTQKTYTINLNPGNYDVTNQIRWDNSTGTSKKLIINGNNNVISGKNSYTFINVTSDNTLELNNITLKNFKTAIYSNKGKISLTNCTLTNNTVSLTNNTVSNGGSAIYSSYCNVSLYNSTLTNNTGKTYGGAIYSDHGNVLLYNSSLSGNTAKYDGGAIHSRVGNVSLYNSTLTGNTANGGGGGAIYSSDGNVLLYNSTLMGNSGAAIYSFSGNVLLYNSTLSGNTAKNGGAIYSFSGNVLLYNSTLSGNTANGGGGGAIDSYRGNVSLYNSTLSGNTANYGGGAIRSILDTVLLYNSTANVLLYNSTLSGNTAKYGGAIASISGNVSLYNSTLSGNTANSSGGAIYSNCSKLICTNAVMENNHANYRGGAIYYASNDTLNDKKIIFLNNSAKEGNNIYHYNPKTRIDLNDTMGVYRDTISITGKLVDNDNNKGISDQYVKYDVDGIKGRSKTNYNGIFNISLRLNGTGVKKVFVEFEGRDYYLPSNVTKTLSKYQIIVSQSRIDLNDTMGVYRDTISITGKLVDNDNNKGISDQYVKYDVDGIKGRSYANNGVFSISLRLNSTGVKKVFVEFEGNNYYLPSNVTKKLTVSKRSTIIKVDEVVKSVGAVTIKGRLTDSTDTKLRNTNIYVTLNGKTQHLLADVDGVFVANFTVSKTGLNDLSIIYKGNKNYEGTEYTSSLDLVSQDDAVITFFNIEPATYHNVTKVNGKVTDNDGNTCAGTVVSVIINNETVDVTTNSKGQFTISYLTKNAGINNVTTVYEKCQTPLKTFMVNKRTTQLILNQTKDAKQEQTVTITGQLLDQFDVKLRNANIYIKVNTQTYHVMTNNEGIYTLDYTTEIKGLNNVTVTYKGNPNYEKTTQKTSFQVN